jgi:hypothetical protein
MQDRARVRELVELAAFDHYLRTGERFDLDKLVELFERKFNPYHDEIGRFTSPPGVTVSYGRSGARQPSQPPGGNASSRAGAASPCVSTRTPDAPRAQADPGSPNGFRSEFVRDAVAPVTNNADSYFELNKRQAHLNRLRQEAGPNARPAVRADLEDYQRRLDANRTLLDERNKIANREIAEIFRAGLAPVDVGAGALNIVSGEGELRDYLSVAGAIPVGGMVGKVGGKIVGTGRIAKEGVEPTTEVVQQGGAFRELRRVADHHRHHMPADSISPLKRGDGPSISILKKDHKKTASFGNKPGAKPHRETQAELIKQGKFSEAQEMDIADIRQKFGNKYDKAIEHMLKYTKDKGL